MKIMSLLDDIFMESAEISPTLAPISPTLAQRKTPETGHLSPFSPFSPTKTDFPLEPRLNGGFTEVVFNQATTARPCPLCGGDLNHEGLDGCYHRAGEVPYPEQVIDGLHPCSQCGGEFFYEGNRGGYFCKKCQSLPEGSEPVRVVRGMTPRDKRPLRGDDPGYTAPPLKSEGCEDNSKLSLPHDNPKLDSPIDRSPKKGGGVSPAALTWLQDHKQELKAAGWPASQLWRRNRSKGIAWSPMWTRSFLKVTLLESGAVEFEFVENGRDVINKAYPMPLRKNKRSAKI